MDQAQVSIQSPSWALLLHCVIAHFLWPTPNSWPGSSSDSRCTLATSLLLRPSTCWLSLAVAAWTLHASESPRPPCSAALLCLHRRPEAPFPASVSSATPSRLDLRLCSPSPRIAGPSSQLAPARLCFHPLSEIFYFQMLVSQLNSPLNGAFYRLQLFKLKAIEVEPAPDIAVQVPGSLVLAENQLWYSFLVQGCLPSGVASLPLAFRLSIEGHG